MSFYLPTDGHSNFKLLLKILHPQLSSPAARNLPSTPFLTNMEEVYKGQPLITFTIVLVDRLGTHSQPQICNL